jgi:hypothetical protein
MDMLPGDYRQHDLSSFENLVCVSGGECGCVIFCLGQSQKL